MIKIEVADTRHYKYISSILHLSLNRRVHQKQKITKMISSEKVGNKTQQTRIVYLLESNLIDLDTALWELGLLSPNVLM